MITCKSFEAWEAREWLVTNGIGGFASGTLAGSLSRTYHGYLVAALEPPLGRTVLVGKVDETITIGDESYRLYTDRWSERPNQPDIEGVQYLDSFHLDGSAAVWVFDVEGTRLEKRVWMAYGHNTTYVQYGLLSAEDGVQLSLHVQANYTDFHTAVAPEHMSFAVESIDNGCCIRPGAGQTFYIYSNFEQMQLHNTWSEGYFLPVEAYRGEPDVTHHLHVASFSGTLSPESDMALIFSTEPDSERNSSLALTQIQSRSTKLVEQSGLTNAPAWIQRLTLAADQFIVSRHVAGLAEGRTVIAGYPWFGDWGRDTMIALPGLALATRRFEEAAAILRTFARFVDQGMLPNRFPDDNEAPEYNTVDATLWYFEAIRQYDAATGDHLLVRDLFPVLVDIIEWHLKGTRYQIHVDPKDGLLYAGQAGVQLTWMDVKIGDWVVTPRTGKAIEINALWYNALRTMAGFASVLGKDDPFSARADLVQANFTKFWNKLGYCFDVIDGPMGSDASLRPNQVIAAALLHSPLSFEQRKQIVDLCQQTLLTPRGLRSLASDHKDYIGHYGGDRPTRDAAYHQGTVWGWLIGPFTAAHWYVYRDREACASFLSPFAQHLDEHGIGTISEVFDGDFPHTSRGCFAQAWSVAEVLRTWRLTQQDSSLDILYQKQAF